MGRCTGHMTHGDERFNCSRASGHLGRCVCRMKVYPEGSFIEKPYGNVMKEGARALVEADPARAALLLRSWISTDEVANG